MRALLTALIALFAVSACGGSSMSGDDIGAPCESDDACVHGLCVDGAYGTEWEGGFCTQPCNKNSECPTGSLCSQDTESCLPECTTDLGCRDGYECTGRHTRAQYIDEDTPQPIDERTVIEDVCWGGP